MRPQEVARQLSLDVKTVRRYLAAAEDIITACSKVRRFVAGMTFEAFAADERTQDAVIRNIEIIGEAAKNIPDDVVAKAPEIFPDPTKPRRNRVRPAVLSRH